MAVALKVLIARWVDDEPQPGIVECSLTDRFGRHWVFMEKCALVSSAALCSDSAYPLPGAIDCHIISAGIDDDGRHFTVVDTEEPWGVSAVDGGTRFEVFVDQLDRR